MYRVINSTTFKDNKYIKKLYQKFKFNSKLDVVISKTLDENLQCGKKNYFDKLQHYWTFYGDIKTTLFSMTNSFYTNCYASIILLHKPIFTYDRVS